MPVRSPVAVVSLALLASVLLGLTPDRAAAATTCAAGPDDATTASNQDVDHDLSRYPDHVIGIPREVSKAGVIELRSTTGLIQRLTESSFTGGPARVAGDGFGTSVAFVDANADRCADVAVGAPGASAGRGAVVVALGSTTGILGTGSVRLTGRTPGEHFGAVVVAVGQDLFVAAPDRTVSGRARAGAVDHYRVGTGGAPTLLETLTEDTPGVPGVSEADDRFGSVLTGATQASGAPQANGSWLVVGEPSEDNGTRRDAGSVTVLSFNDTTHRLSLGRVVAQGVAGTPGVSETGDTFGAAVAFWGDPAESYLAIGTPGEDVGSHRDGGQVQTFTGMLGTAPLRPSASFTQDSPEVPGAVEAGDQFGASLQAGWFAVAQGGCSGHNAIDLAVGAPGEDLGSRRDAGTVTFVPLGPTRPSEAWCRHAWYQGGPGGISATAEAGDRFGAVLGLGAGGYLPAQPYPQGQPPTELLISVPGEDVGSKVDAGVFHTLIVDLVTGIDFGGAAGTAFGSVFAGSAS
ncbi:integrin alpha [Angustibacter luteus]|uniref:FG-GAP repeat protein n=1 Tax=Angustibacter luteus TaxID=658456 RepID=A0ABW1JF77_9ACTN